MFSSMIFDDEFIARRLGKDTSSFQNPKSHILQNEFQIITIIRCMYEFISITTVY